VKRPKGTVAERQALSAEQIEDYVKAVLDERLAALFILALFTTMREGEILGLQWSDVDLAARAIAVKHAWKKQRGAIDPETGKQRYTYGLGTTKTPKSRRRILLPQIVMDSLQIHRKRMMLEGHGSTFVFVGRRGKPIGPTNLRTRLHYPIIERAMLPKVTFHDLRHSAATVMLELGVHPKIAQERLGHSSSRITMDRYSHALPTMQQSAVDAIDARFGGLARYAK
jgi:integrase